MTAEQERVLKAFVERGWVKGMGWIKGETISLRVGLGSDYADSLCQQLCKDGYVEREGEGRDKVYRLTAQGREALRKARTEAVEKEVRRK